MRPKIIPATYAATLIPDGMTVATSGFIDFGFPNAIAAAIEHRFKDSGHPNNLTLVHAAGQMRIGHFAHKGLTRRVIAGYYGWSTEMQRMALSGEIEAYNWPQGVIVNLYREMAAGRRFHYSHIGLGTFVEQDCGKIVATANAWGPQPCGMDGLRYPTFPIHVALIRAARYDSRGNLTMAGEKLTLETLHLAMAVHNSGGIVIAEVDGQMLSANANPYFVKIPNQFVDYIVEAPREPEGVAEYGWSTDEVKWSIAKRAAQEIRGADIVNLGIGLPELVGRVLDKEDRISSITLTTESGTIGGLPQTGKGFGFAYDADAILDMNYQFDFYNGGGLDVAILGFAEIDRAGNVNVSKFGDRLPGCGGFIDISQSAKRIVFVGKEDANGKSKIVDRVEHLTFSAAHALRRFTEVKYVTDNGVYALTKSGLEKIG